MLPLRQAAWSVLLVEPAAPAEVLAGDFVQHLDSHGCPVRRIHEIDGAVLLLQRDHARLVILNPNFPGHRGVEVFSAIKRAAQTTPIIVLVHPDQLGVGSECMALGAVDYLVRGSFDPRRLQKRVRREIHLFETEASLRQEANLLRALLEHLPDRIYFKDRESRFLRVSLSLARLFKLDEPGQAVGKTDFDFFAREHALAAYEDEQTIIRSAEPLVNRVEREDLPDGSATWALTNKAPLRDHAGHIIGTFGISRDITELHTIQETLAEDRNLLRRLIDSIPDSIFVKDTSSRFVVANRFVAQLMGADSPDELIGRTDFDFYARENAQAFYDDEQRILHTGEPLLNREEAVVLIGRDVRWVLTTKVPYRDRSGKISGIMGISRDITERRNAEDALRRVNAELGQVLEQLRETQVHLADSARQRSVGDLASGLAVRVSAPLQDVITALEANTDALTANPAARARHERALAAARQASAVFSHLLDYARPSLLDRHPLQLAPLLDHAVNLTLANRQARSVRLTRDSGADGATVEADEGKLVQVFVDLLLNAIAAVPEGGEVAVRTSWAGDGDGRHVAIAIQDNGPGIPAEILPHLFDPFAASAAGHRRPGLGLPVARTIVDLHGGRLVVANRPERGLEALVLLPVT